MNKTELIAAVAEKTGLSKKDTEAAVNATLTALGDALDEAEAAGTDIVDVTRDGEPVVYDAESTDVSDEDSSKT